MDEGQALRIKQWATAHYHRHQPADAARTLLELLRGQEEVETGRIRLPDSSGVEEEGVAEEWRPTVGQVFWWTFVSQGPHAALAFLDSAEAAVAEAPSVFIMAASSLLHHGGPLLGVAAARMAEKCELVLSRASRALELAFDPGDPDKTMATVAGLLIRCGDFLLAARRDIIEVPGAVEKLVAVLLSLRGQDVCDPDLILAGLQLGKHMQRPALDQYQPGQYSQERSARVREAIIGALLNHFNQEYDDGLELLLLGIQDEDASVALMAVDGLTSWVELPACQLSIAHRLPQLVDVLVKHIALPDVKSLLALCVDCVVAHHRQQEQQASGSIALLPIELQELITKELNREPHPIKTALGAMQVPDINEPIGEQVRKASAMCLDVLSQCSEDLAVEMLRVIPAMVQSDSPWQHRECGVFLMGIAAESMYDSWKPSSTEQLLRLFGAAALPSLAAPQPKLRQIACWTASRFARSVLNTDGTRRGNDINGRAVVDCLLEIMRTDLKVHSAVTTALANLVEEGLFRQMPEQGHALLENIITLGCNPSAHLLDLINTCLESPGFTSIVDVEFEQRLVPLLLNTVERAILDLDLSNKSTMDYLDIALSAVGNAVPSMENRIKPVLERVAGQIELVCAHQATGAEEAENQQQLVGACMDLCSRLFEQGCDLSPFISPARLVALADLPSQEGFALLGELAKLGPDPLKDSLPHIEAVLEAFFAEQRAWGRDPVLHNAEWAAGQLARHMATGLQLPWVNNFLALCRFGTHNRAVTLLQLGLHHAHVLPASLLRDALVVCLPCFTPDQEPWAQSRAVIVAGFPNLVLRCLVPAGPILRLSETKELLMFFVRQIDWLCCRAPEASPSYGGGTEAERSTSDDEKFDFDDDEQRVRDALNALASAEQAGEWVDETADDNERGRWRAIVEHYVVPGAAGRHYAPLLLALRRTPCPP